MNLMLGTLVTLEGGLGVRINAHTLPLEGHDPAALQPYRDRPVIVGIRPEDMYEEPPAHLGATAELPAEVLAVEPLGAETLLALRMGGVDEDVTARVGRQSYARIWDTIRIVADLGTIQLFDPDTSKVISVSSVAPTQNRQRAAS